MVTIKRTRVRVKHKYIPSRVNTHTEYKAVDEDGNVIYDTRNGKILHHVAQFKNLLKHKFDINKDDMIVDENVKTRTKQGWM